jgi:hypothetical protein
MTWRTLHVSRAAICSMLVTAPVTISSSQRGRNDRPWLEESKNQRGSGDALDLFPDVHLKATLRTERLFCQSS